MKPIYLITGPSKFTDELVHMVEDFFGGNPILLYGEDEENLKYWVSQASALILGGGADLHYTTYNQSYPAGQHMKNFDIKRDKKEIKLIDMCIKQKVPMLCICRGFQLICVKRLGLPILFDISDSMVIHQPAMQEPNYTPDPEMPIHKVSILEDRLLFGEKPPEGKKFKPIWTNSFHHQSIEADYKTKNNPHVVGIAQYKNNDDIVEIAEHVEEGWIGCQWHPEYDYFCQKSSHDLLTYFKKFYVEERGFLLGKKEE